MIESNSLFRSDELVGRRFAAALGFASRARVRTRENFIADMMLVREGDCRDDQAVAASIRTLRALRFVARAEAEIVPRADSSLELRVRVWDAWSTLVGVEGAIDGRPRLLGATVAETNFLGRGHTVSLRSHEYRERREFGADFRSERLAGEHVVTSFGGGVTRTGHYGSAGLSRPFLSEVSRFSFTMRGAYEDHDQAWYTGDRELTRVLLPVAERSVRLMGYYRLGEPGRLVLLGGELTVMRRTVSGAARAVWHDDYGRPMAAPETLMTALGPQVAPPSYLRAGFTAGWRGIHYVEVRGLDLVHGVQDVALGRDVVVSLGRSLTSFASGPTDTWLRTDAYAAARRGAWLAVSQLQFEGRYLDRVPGRSSRVRDVRAHAHGQLSRSTTGVVSQTFVFSATGETSRNSDEFQQGLVSGYGGIRGYADGAFPAGHQVLGTFEDRVNFPVMHPAVDLGATLFGDLGRGWASGVPFGRNTGWRASVGTGLRLGFPARSGANGRVEIAWPVESARLRAPALRGYVSILSARR